MASDPNIEGSEIINNEEQMECNELDGGDFEQQLEIPQAEDNGSSNFAFDDNLTFEQQSNEKEETNGSIEQDAFIADLAEENANRYVKK